MPEWTRIREIFEEVVELPEAERGPRLDELCAGEPEVRRRVESLLAEDAGVATPAIEGVTAVQLAVPDPSRLERIGAYRIVRVLGAGGMGTVFEARQEKPQRTVALKVLRTFIGSEMARRRLEYEAEALGRLHHPNVAQIHESGTWRDPDTGEESPFFAMEFVQGARPLDVYANEEGLDLRGRLELFLQVCDAVHHGHQQGVLHRDLKPQNVLVGEDGRPKVIDFGIARATDAAGDGRTMQTMTGQVLGTLGYMSPEQIDGDPAVVDVRADVYSLGATLFELLVGRPPHEKGDESLVSFLARVRSETAPRPSTCAGAKLQIPPDLDWIVLRAVATEPAERYPAVSELAADLRRLLADEPVSARPPTSGYLLRKFVRRNRTLVAAVAAVMLAMLVGTVATAIGWQRALSAEEQAEERRLLAEATAEELLKLSHLQGDLLRGAQDDPNIRLRDVLERASAELAKEEALNPTIAGGLHTALGTSFKSLGLLDKARMHYERALELVGGQPSRRRQYLEIRANYASLLYDLGKFEETESVRREVLEGFLEIYGDEHEQVAYARGGLAIVLAERGDNAGAAELYRLAIASHETTHGRDSEILVAPLTGLATALHRLGKDEEAAPLYAEACELARKHFGAEDPQTLTAMQHHAGFLLDCGRIEQARERFEAMLEVETRKYGSTHARTTRTLTNLGLCYEKEERYADAEAAYRKILAAREEAGGGREPVDLITRFNLCVALHRQDDRAKLEEAVERLADLVRDAAEVFPEGNWRLAVFRQHLGIALRKSGRYAEAEVELSAAGKVLEARLGGEHERTRSNWRQMAELYEAWGKPDDARRWREKLGDG